MGSTLSTNGQHAEPLIRLDRISKSFEEGGRERVVLHEVSAAFAPGEFVVLIGKSGSGKSTLLNLVSGIDTPTAGEVWVAGKDLTRLSEPERTRSTCLTRSAWPTGATPTRTGSPAASSSASPSRARWSTTRSWCWPTS